MGDLERVLEALKKADADGNIEDAEKLAEIAVRLQSQPAKESDVGVMPFVNKGIASSLGFPVDAITGAMNLIPGVDIKEPVGGSKNIERGMESIGVSLPPEGRDPQKMSEFIGRGVGEVAGGVNVFGKVAQLVSKGAGLASKISRSMVSSMGKHPYITMTSELSAGAGAGGARGVAETEDMGGPGVKATAEMIGGVVGGATPTVVAFAPTMMLLRQGKRIVQRVSMPFSKEGSKYRASEYVRGLVGETGAVSKKITQETLSDLPPAVKSGEEKLISLYKTLIGQDVQRDAETINKISKEIIGLEKELRKLGYGSPKLLAEITQKRIAALELDMDKRILKATETASKKLNSIPVAERQYKESIIVRSELEQAMHSERVAVNELWNEVPKDIKVSVSNTRSRFATIMEETPKAQLEDIPSDIRNSFIVNTKDLEETTLKEMQGLRSKLLERSRNARKDGNWNYARIADEFSDAILDDIGLYADREVTPEAAKLKAALSATRHFKTQFESGVVGKILGYSKSGAPAIDPSLTLDMSIGRMGTKGGVDINKVAVTPEARQSTEKYLSRSWADYSARNGIVDKSKSERWITNNEAILDQFPELRNNLTDAAKAQEHAANITKRMETRKARLRNPNVSVSAKYLNSANMNREIETILKDPRAPSVARQLALQSQKDVSGKSIEGLRAGFVEYLLDKSSIGAFNELGEQTLSGRTLLSFVNKNIDTLSQVFDSDQIQRMRMVGSELAKIEKYEGVKRGTKGIEMDDVASKALALFARIAGARLGGIAGRESAGGSLQMAQIASSRFKVFMNYVTKNRAEALITDAVMSDNPKLLLSLLKPIDNPMSVSGRKAFGELNTQMNIWLLGSGKRVYEDILEEIKLEGESK